MTNTSQGVENIIDSPTANETVTLIISTTDEPGETVKSHITDAGGTIEETVPFNCLAVTIPEANVEHLREINGIEQIEIEGAFTAGETNPTEYAGHSPEKAVEINSTAEEIFDI